MTWQHVLKFYSLVVAYLLIQIKMADEDTIAKLLELYQKCKMNGENASFFMETMKGKDTTITFTINCPAAGAPPADPIRRRKTPSQLRRDKERREKFIERSWIIQLLEMSKKELTRKLRLRKFY